MMSSSGFFVLPPLAQLSSPLAQLSSPAPGYVYIYIYIYIYTIIMNDVG